MQKYAEKELQDGLRHLMFHQSLLNVTVTFSLQQVGVILLYFITLEGFCKFSLFLADS